MKNFNKKGFTLVELLATIVILGIISVIAVVSVDAMLDHSREVECDSILQSITNAAKKMVSDNRYNLVNTNDIPISVSTLTEKGYLTSVMKDPFTNKTLGDDVKENIIARVTLNDDYTVDSVVIINSDEFVVKCYIDKEEISGDTPANVVLFPGVELE